MERVGSLDGYTEHVRIGKENVNDAVNLKKKKGVDGSEEDFKIVNAFESDCDVVRDKEEDGRIDVYKLLLEKKCTVKNIVRSVIEMYRENENVGLCVVVTLLVRASGFNGEVKTDTIYNDESVEFFAEIQKMEPRWFSKDHHFLGSTGAKAFFKKRFSEFLTLFMENTRLGCLLENDGLVIRRLVKWMISMSSCNYRVFRHVSTFSILLINTSLCKISRDFIQQLNKMSSMNKIHDNKKACKYFEDIRANKRGQNRKTSNAFEKIYSMIPKEEKCVYERIILIEEMLETVFNGVFIHRYKDVDPNIRSLCIKNLGILIKSYPDMFLDSSYLRYLGWLLSDKSQKSRISSLNSIRGLVDPPEKEIHNNDCFKSFISRFGPRMVEIALRDKDQNCQIASLGLILCMVSRGVVENFEIDDLFVLLFHCNTKIQLLAGSLVFNFCIDVEKRLFVDDDVGRGQFHCFPKRFAKSIHILRNCMSWIYNEFYKDVEICEWSSSIATVVLDTVLKNNCKDLCGIEALNIILGHLKRTKICGESKCKLVVDLSLNEIKLLPMLIRCLLSDKNMKGLCPLVGNPLSFLKLYENDNFNYLVLLDIYSNNMESLNEQDITGLVNIIREKIFCVEDEIYITKLVAIVKRIDEENSLISDVVERAMKGKKLSVIGSLLSVFDSNMSMFSVLRLDSIKEDYPENPIDIYKIVYKKVMWGLLRYKNGDLKDNLENEIISDCQYILDGICLVDKVDTKPLLLMISDLMIATGNTIKESGRRLFISDLVLRSYESLVGEILQKLKTFNEELLSQEFNRRTHKTFLLTSIQFGQSDGDIDYKVLCSYFKLFIFRHLDFGNIYVWLGYFGLVQGNIQNIMVSVVRKLIDNEKDPQKLLEGFIKSLIHSYELIPQGGDEDRSNSSIALDNGLCSLYRFMCGYFKNPKNLFTEDFVLELYLSLIRFISSKIQCSDTTGQDNGFLIFKALNTRIAISTKDSCNTVLDALNNHIDPIVATHYCKYGEFYSQFKRNVERNSDRNLKKKRPFDNATIRAADPLPTEPKNDKEGDRITSNCPPDLSVSGDAINGEGGINSDFWNFSHKDEESYGVRSDEEDNFIFPTSPVL